MEMAETGRLIEVAARTGSLYVIPPWGYLEAVEVRFTPPLANMDASAPLRLILEPMDGAGSLAGMQVFARVRDVVEGGRGG